MKITEKKFSIIQLTENRAEFMIVEIFYILGMSLYYRYHFNYNKAFKSVFLAIKAKDSLIAQEKKKQIKRNLTIVLTLISFLCILIIMALS